jgi:hypothetical protein
MNKKVRKLTDDGDKKTKSTRGAWKVLRVTRRKNYYAMQPARTLANRKRRLARHLRRYPEDAQGAAVCAKAYTKTFSDAQLAAPCGKARARAREAARQARRTQARIAAVQAAEAALGLHSFVVEPPTYAPFAP